MVSWLNCLLWPNRLALFTSWYNVEVTNFRFALKQLIVGLQPQARKGGAYCFGHSWSRFLSCPCYQNVLCLSQFTRAVCSLQHSGSPFFVQPVDHWWMNIQGSMTYWMFEERRTLFSASLLFELYWRSRL